MLNVSKPSQSQMIGEAWPDALLARKSIICPNTVQMCGIKIKHDVYDPNEKEQTRKRQMLRTYGEKRGGKGKETNPYSVSSFCFFWVQKNPKPADDTDHPLDLFFYSSHV